MKYPRLQDPEWLRSQVAKGLTDEEIGRAAGGAGRQSANNARRRLGIERRQPVASQWPLLQDRRWLEARVSEGMTDSEIGEAAGGAPKTTVRDTRRRLGIKALGPPVGEVKWPLLQDLDWLTAQVEAGMSDDKIAAAVGGAPATAVSTARLRHGIRRRAPWPARPPVDADVAHAAADVLEREGHADFAPLVSFLRGT